MIPHYQGLTRSASNTQNVPLFISNPHKDGRDTTTQIFAGSLWEKNLKGSYFAGTF